MKKNLLNLFAILVCGATALAQAPTSGLIAYYGFEDNANSHNGLHNFSNDSYGEHPSATFENNGRVGKGVVFSGQQALVNTTLNTAISAATPMTVSFWFKDSTASQNTYGTQIELFYSFLCRYQTKLKSEINTTAGYYALNAQNQSPTTGSWKHVTLTYDPANNSPLSMWVNGSSIGSTFADAVMVRASGNIVVGNGLASDGTFHPQKGYKGMIDELYVYNRVLTGDEIGNVMNNTLGVTQPILTNVTVADITATSANINYTVNPNYDTAQTEVRYGTSAENLSNVITGSSLTGSTNTNLSVSLSGLTPSTTYYYKVSATNQTGTVTSDVLSFTTTMVTAPTLSLVFANQVTYNSAAINYTINPITTTNVTYYVRYGLDPEATLLSSPSTQTNTGEQFSSYTMLYGLQPSTTYYYQVLASSRYGTNISSFGTFTTLAAPLAIVIEPVNVIEVTDTSATITYALNAGVGNTTVTLDYGTSELDNQTVTIPGGNGTTQELRYTLTNLTPDTQYNFTITATNGQTTGYYTTGTFTTATLGTDTYKRNSVSAYPNPAANIVNIVSVLPVTEVKIYNFQGVTVATTNTNAIDVSALQSGIYLIKVTAEDNTTWETKLIKK